MSRPERRLLDGKLVAITGAAGGLGRPVARLLREQGAHVTGIDCKDCPECDETVIADLSDSMALRGLCEELAENPPDILVNIAGVVRFGLHQSQPIEAIELCYRVNLTVPAILARAVAAPMAKRGTGHIVNIGSVMGAIPYPWFAAYSSSKAGLAALSQALRRELAPCGIAITHINPRAARTAFNNDEVNRFLELTGMKADDPQWVAERIVAAILARRETVTIGIMERIYAALNALAPRLIDLGLSGQIKRLRAEFQS